MNLVPQFPKKLHFLHTCSFPSVSRFFVKKSSFGGRIGYSKEWLFTWLLVKKITHWDYRTVAEMAGIAHSTLVRANQQFLEKKIYERLFRELVKHAYRRGVIVGQHVALDSSFVKTFSRKSESGSGGWNGKKEAYGFKLHALVDATTEFPLALIVGDGLTHDSQVAIPLLKRARPWLKKVGYVLADKGYDSTVIVAYIAKSLKAKAGIPIRRTPKRNHQRKRPGNFHNWWLKARGRTVKRSLLRKRSSVERVFSYCKHTYHLGQEATRGINSFTKNVYLTLISYMINKLYTHGSTIF